MEFKPNDTVVSMVYGLGTVIEVEPLEAGTLKNPPKLMVVVNFPAPSGGVRAGPRRVAADTLTSA